MSRPRRGRAVSCSALLLIAALVAAQPSYGVHRSPTPQPGAVASSGKVWRTIEGGGSDTCGLRLDATLWCWGDNAHGKLGVGDTIDRLTPTQVGRDDNWDHISLGLQHGCAIRLDHTLWCWGSNARGQLGLGDVGTRRVPTEVGRGRDWALIRTGDAFTCATRLGGSLWCWGFNGFGQLGLGDRV